MHGKGRDVQGGDCIARQLNREHGASPAADPSRWPDTGSEPAVVSQAFHAACELLIDCLARGDVELESTLAADLPRVSLTSAELRHLVLNMIDDAVHASPSGARVDARAELRDDGMVRLLVSHEGTGLGKDELERSFGPGPELAQGDGRHHGLAVCRELVKKGSGVLVMQSSPTQGCELQVLLPPA